MNRVFLVPLVIAAATALLLLGGCERSIDSLKVVSSEHAEIQGELGFGTPRRIELGSEDICLLVRPGGDYSSSWQGHIVHFKGKVNTVIGGDCKRYIFLTREEQLQDGPLIPIQADQQPSPFGGKDPMLMSQDELYAIAKGKSRQGLMKLFGPPSSTGPDLYIYRGLGTEPANGKRYSACNFHFKGGMSFSNREVRSVACYS